MIVTFVMGDTHYSKPAQNSSQNAPTPLLTLLLNSRTQRMNTSPHLKILSDQKLTLAALSSSPRARHSSHRAALIPEMVQLQGLTPEEERASKTRLTKGLKNWNLKHTHTHTSLPSLCYIH